MPSSKPQGWLTRSDVKQPKLRVARPIKKEPIGLIIAIANQASEAKKNGAKTMVQGAYYAHPSAPREDLTPKTNMVQGKRNSDRAMARLLGSIR